MPEPESTSNDGDGPLRWEIGEVTVARVVERVTAVPTELLVPGVTTDHLDTCRSWAIPTYFTDDGRLLLSVHSFVVESEGTTIVVDTCVGEAERPLPGDAEFPERLDAAVPGGLAAVDVVLCTHLHFDHVGWNTRMIGGALVPTFPNARYLFSTAELDHLSEDDHAGVREPSVQPLLDARLVDLVATDHQITSEVRLTPTPGHTPGHVSVVIESGGARALITGDAFHTPLQFRYPELSASPFDWDTTVATATRRELLEELTDSDTLVLGTHFAPPTAGHVHRGDDGIGFGP